MGRNSNNNFVATSIDVFNAADATSEMDDHFISKKDALITHPIIQSRCKGLNYYERALFNQVHSPIFVPSGGLYRIIVT